MTDTLVVPGADLYRAHLEAVCAQAREALEVSARAGAAFAGVVLHAGSEALYWADDQHLPFRSVPHFARFAPLAGPGHVLVLPREGEPRLVRFQERSFWVQAPGAPPLPLEDALSVSEAADGDALQAAVGDVTGYAYVGNDPGAAEKLGLPPEAVEPKALVTALDWFRAYKTPYEVACLREAARIGGLGHAAVRAGVAAGRSEFQLHLDYLEATGLCERELPYETIVAWDEASAVLHYQAKRRAAPRPGATFLIDAGGAYLGYCSDITRSYLREDAAPGAGRDLFAGVLGGMNALQEQLCQAARPGLSFHGFHELSFRGVTRLLIELGILRASEDEAFELALAKAFFPHGLGHHLGLQVHDVGAKLLGPEGGDHPADPRYPFLRTGRPLEPGHVVTVEPGLYFIPMLLEPLRAGEHAARFDWAAIDALVPFGGVRVEDDVLVTATGVENLTRPYVPVTVHPLSEAPLLVVEGDPRYGAPFLGALYVGGGLGLLATLWVLRLLEPVAPALGSGPGAVALTAGVLVALLSGSALALRAARRRQGAAALFADRIEVHKGAEREVLAWSEVGGFDERAAGFVQLHRRGGARHSPALCVPTPTEARRAALLKLLRERTAATSEGSERQAT